MLPASRASASPPLPAPLSSPTSPLPPGMASTRATKSASPRCTSRSGEGGQASCRCVRGAVMGAGVDFMVCSGYRYPSTPFDFSVRISSPIKLLPQMAKPQGCCSVAPISACAVHTVRQLNTLNSIPSPCRCCCSTMQTSACAAALSNSLTYCCHARAGRRRCTSRQRAGASRFASCCSRRTWVGGGSGNGSVNGRHRRAAQDVRG